MSPLVLTQSSGILSPISKALGWIMNGIYVGLSNLFHVHNVALTIIIFTVIIYMVLLPLTYQQQKFSKMSQIMNPELRKIQGKYKGRRDQVSVTAMNQETQALYKKYGVSPSGSCIYLIIQLPILFALYRVIYNVPAYVSSVKNTFASLATSISHTDGFKDIMEAYLKIVKNGSYGNHGLSLDWSSAATTHNSIIDVLYKSSTENWSALAEKFPDLSGSISAVSHKASQFNDFLGLNVVYSPKNIIADALSHGKYILIVLAILIPIVSAATQFLNIKLMPQPNAGDNPMGGQLKIMNYMMPVYSFFMVLLLPIGVGIYWIAGAVIRCIQQYVINKRLDKIDLKEYIKKNQEKHQEQLKKKAEKRGISGDTISSAAKISTRTIDANGSIRKDSMTAKAAASTKDIESIGATGKLRKDSLAAKANKVREFNEGKK